mmetsp:Transcript_33560/g.94244  ORF Transcript_33560/g.94244 Transcript_33560/m.94244 type:complete len:204 (+) Transcript_33560:1663-2274(+)
MLCLWPAHIRAGRADRNTAEAGGGAADGGPADGGRHGAERPGAHGPVQAGGGRDRGPPGPGGRHRRPEQPGGHLRCPPHHGDRVQGEAVGAPVAIPGRHLRAVEVREQCDAQLRVPGRLAALQGPQVPEGPRRQRLSGRGAEVALRRLHQALPPLRRLVQRRVLHLRREHELRRRPPRHGRGGRRRLLPPLGRGHDVHRRARP